MIATLTLAALMTKMPGNLEIGQKIQEDQTTRVPAPLKTCAVLPWPMKDGTETAITTARDTIVSLFKGVNYEIIPDARSKAYWEEELGMKPIPLVLEGKKQPLPDMPRAQDLLKLGQLMKVDLVCAGRLSWHTRSIWVSLGPKTKATCTVDVMIVDVAAKEIVLDAKNVSVDSHKKESAAETAGALLLSMGITAFSGGPKTPHQQRSAQFAISEALEPWLKTVAPKSRKIDDTGGSTTGGGTGG